MSSRSSRRATQRLQALTVVGAVHPHPDSVVDPLFRDSAFFDPNDLLQVKYEMLRQVRVEGQPVSQSATAFGFSRPSFYQAQSTFDREGLSGLVPRKRGPRRAHKLAPEVMEFVVETRVSNPSLRLEELARLIEERFSLRVHPRSIERRLLLHQKKRP